MRDNFVIRLPATAANLGPGFDCLGLAMTLYNDFHVRVRGGVVHQIHPQGFGAELLADPKKNLFISAYEATCRRHQVPAPGLDLLSRNRLPLKSGSGSSATAIVGGVAAAHLINDLGGDYPRMLADALALEPHPDNLAACLYGGFTVAIVGPEGPLVTKTALDYPLHLWLLHPERTVDTQESRAALPKKIAMVDGVYSLSRACLLTAALVKGELDLLYEGMKDRIHEPFRMDPHMEYPVLKRRLRGPEFYGWAVSGSGPSVVALCAEITPRLRALVAEHFGARGVAYRDYALRVDNHGLRIFDPSDLPEVDHD